MKMKAMLSPTKEDNMHMLQHTPFNPWKPAFRLMGAPTDAASWLPAFDITETDNAVVLRGDVPGVLQEDIEIRVEDGILTVRGERERAEKVNGFGRSERLFGKFKRTFRLGDSLDADGIKASYANGVLELTLPKREPAETSRLIPIN